MANSICISSVEATVLELFGIERDECTAESNPIISALSKKYLCGKNVDRVLIYNPDAVALWLYQKYTALFADAAIRSNVAIPMLSVMPSVTPVCFASMYSGVMPNVHGIKTYTKPVLKVDTLFDRVAKAGKKAAIVSTTGDSVSKIFLERKIDYFIYDTVDEVNRKASELMTQDEHDLLVVYNGNYDGAMHRCGPEGNEALTALRHNIAEYASLVDEAQEKWAQHNVFFGFCPDHGCHEIDGGCGSHGLDMPEDMDIIHFYGIRPAADNLQHRL